MDLLTTYKKQFPHLFRPDAPLVAHEAIKLIGTTEIPGKVHNPVIMGWAEAAGVKALYTGDEMAWCALAHYIVLWRAGKRAVNVTGWNILRALGYVNYGVKSPRPGVGDTMVFSRAGGAHVGVYVAERPGYYYIMGGNQKNQYNIMQMEMERFVAARSPEYKIRPATAVPMFVNARGIAISTNEA